MADWRQVGLTGTPETLDRVIQEAGRAHVYLSGAVFQLCDRLDAFKRFRRHRGYLYEPLPNEDCWRSPHSLCLATGRAITRLDAAHDAAGIVFALALRAHLGVGTDADGPSLQAWRAHRADVFRCAREARRRVRLATARVVASLDMAPGWEEWILAFDHQARRALGEVGEAVAAVALLYHAAVAERGAALHALLS